VTDQLVLASAAVAVAISMFALLVSLGTAMRVNQGSISRMGAQGLEAGDAVPAAELRSLISDGADRFMAGPTILAFVTSGCTPCVDMIDALNVRHSAGNDCGPLVVVEPVPAEARSLAESAKFRATWIRDSDRLLANAFKSYSTPQLFLIHAGKVVRAAHGKDVERLIEQAASLAAPPLQLLNLSTS
jgi:hypothetical protein